MSFNMKIFKKNQVIIYVIALMLVTAGYLSYTTKGSGTSSVETSMQMESKDDSKLAGIGDATLVSSNELVSNTTDDTLSDIKNNVTEKNESNNNSNAITNNNSNETNSNVTNETNNSNSDNTNITQETNEKSNTVPTNATSSDDYFTKSKLERDTMYSQMIETYEKVINSNNALETQKQTATQEITKINGTKNSIMICENLIKTKGFENSVVFVNGESISVIVGATEMKPEEVAQIQNIISREMNAKIENIHIANK